MAVISFRVDGVPATKGSWRIMLKPRPRLVPDNPGEEAWAQLVAWTARATLRNRIEPDARRYRIRVVFTLPAPHRNRNKRDLDKLCRSCLDALTGILWKDDEQVDEIIATKRIGDRPGADVEIEAIG